MQNKLVWTCYGIKDESTARQQATNILESGLVNVVEITHTTKATKRAKWKREVFTERMDA